MKAKRNIALLLPFLVAPVFLTGCEEYKHDNPNQMFKNITSRYVQLAYPYADTEKDVSLVFNTPSGFTKVETMRDKENVLKNGLKKIKKFKKAEHVNASGNPIMFSFNHRISKKSVSLSYFSLYKNGNLFCSMNYYVDIKDPMITENVCFKFDADIAEEIYNNAYAEFDAAKEDDAYIHNELITFSNFFKTADEKHANVRFDSDNSHINDDGGAIRNELKKLANEVDLSNEVTEFPITDAGNNFIEYRIVDDNNENSSYFSYNDWDYTSWKAMLSENGAYLSINFDGQSKYGLSERIAHYYRIDATKGKETVDKIKQIVNTLRK